MVRRGVAVANVVSAVDGITGVSDALDEGADDIGRAGAPTGDGSGEGGSGAKEAAGEGAANTGSAARGVTFGDHATGDAPGVTAADAPVAADTPPGDTIGPAETGVRSGVRCAPVPPATAIMPPHTEQRARTPVAGTFPGSTRNTERQSGQVTVIDWSPCSVLSARIHPRLRSTRRLHHPCLRHVDGPASRPTPVMFLHSSSFQSPNRSRPPLA